MIFGVSILDSGSFSNLISIAPSIYFSTLSTFPTSTLVDFDSRMAPPEAMKCVSSIDVSCSAEMKSVISFDPQDNF